MKKSLALITIITCLVAPIMAASGIGINLSTNIQKNLSSSLGMSNSQALAVSFDTKGGSSFYVNNEIGTWESTTAGVSTPGTETVLGLGVRMPVMDSIGVNMMLGNSETKLGVADSTTSPIMDFGAYYERAYADVSVALDISARHHVIDTSTNKHGVRIGVRIGYGF